MVELFHHRHQRHELLAQLHDEAVRNRQILQRDLTLDILEKSFIAVRETADHELAHAGMFTFATPSAPCMAGLIGNEEVRFFAPVDSVWSTARESNLVYLMPRGSATPWND